jgi:hypothetical protein
MPEVGATIIGRWQGFERLRAQQGPGGDVRDVLAARDSLACLLGLWPHKT